MLLRPNIPNRHITEGGKMIITIIVALLVFITLMVLSDVSKARLKEKDREIAKLERLRGNDACEISFMNWRRDFLESSKERAVEEYQKLAGRKMYCVVRGRDKKMNISIGYMIGYRCEVLPLGFIIDFKAGTMTDKMTGDVFPIYE